MDFEHSSTKYRNWYRRLIHLYPRTYRDMFGESMMQTFDDLCNEKQRVGAGALAGFLIWVFADTAFAILNEYLYVTTKAMKNKPFALIGLVLLIPFSAVIATGISWQLLHYLGYAGMPHLAGLIPNRTVGYTLIVIFPAAAFLLNVVVLIINAFKKDIHSVLSTQFVKTNFLTVGIVILSAAAVVFIFGHDSIPCFVHGIGENGFNNIWLNFKGCLNA